MPIELRTLSAIALATCLAVPAAAQTAGAPSPAAASSAGRTARDRAEPRHCDVRRAVDRLAPLRRPRLRSRRRQVRGRPPEALPAGSPDREAERVRKVAFRHGPAVRLDGPGRRPQHPPRDGGAVAPRRGMGAPRDVLQRHPRLQAARDASAPTSRAAWGSSASTRAASCSTSSPRPRTSSPATAPPRPRTASGSRSSRASSWPLGKTLSLDAAFFWTYYKTGSYDMSPLGLPDVDSGFEWGGRLGLAWQPFSAPPDPAQKAVARRPGHGQAAAAPATRRTPRRLGRAPQLGLGDGRDVRDQLRRVDVQRVRARRELQPDQPPQLLGEPRRRASPTTTTSSRPTSWSTRSTARPTTTRRARTGSASGARRGWRSPAPSSWECCGETHPMSFNDMVSTGIGGIARGEVSYRVSSLILDNTKRGKGRFGREAAALLFDPIRGFNRLVSGDASEVKGNPADRWDWRPDFQLAVRAGARVIGEGESISENTNTYGFLEFALNYGNPWDGERHKPYDRFDADCAVELRRQDPPGAPADPGRPLHEAPRGRKAPRPSPCSRTSTTSTTRPTSTAARASARRCSRASSRPRR